MVFWKFRKQKKLCHILQAFQEKTGLYIKALSTVLVNLIYTIYTYIFMPCFLHLAIYFFTFNLILMLLYVLKMYFSCDINKSRWCSIYLIPIYFTQEAFLIAAA